MLLIDHDTFDVNFSERDERILLCHKEVARELIKLGRCDVKVIDLSYIPMLCVLYHSTTDTSDFSVPNSLFFPSGSNNGDVRCINVTIIDDLCFEKNHSFSIHITDTEDNVNTGPFIYALVLIIDNEGMYLAIWVLEYQNHISLMIPLVPQLSFTEAEYFVSEGDGQVTVCVEVTSLNCSEVDIWLTFATMNGSAISE